MEEKGQAVLEFVLSLPVVLLTILATFYLINVGQQKIMAIRAASVASRVAVVNLADGKRVAKTYLSSTNLQGSVRIAFKSDAGGRLKTTITYQPAVFQLFGFNLRPLIRKTFVGPRWQNGIFFDY